MSRSRSQGVVVVVVVRSFLSQWYGAVVTVVKKWCTVVVLKPKVVYLSWSRCSSVAVVVIVVAVVAISLPIVVAKVVVV